jgi:hypothetical protein
VDRLAEMAAGTRSSVLDACQDYRVEAEEYRELDSDRVLVLPLKQIRPARRERAGQTRQEGDSRVATSMSHT